MTCKDIQKVLLDNGHDVKLHVIVYSERRVLQYLDFNMNMPTPYLFVEALLEILGHNEPKLNINCIYLITCRVLEAFYYIRKSIYDRLYESFTGRTRENKTDR